MEFIDFKKLVHDKIKRDFQIRQHVVFNITSTLCVSFHKFGETLTVYLTKLSNLFTVPSLVINGKIGYNSIMWDSFEVISVQVVG